jgi:hypothetical protein
MLGLWVATCRAILELDVFTRFDTANYIVNVCSLQLGDSSAIPGAILASGPLAVLSGSALCLGAPYDDTRLQGSIEMTISGCFFGVESESGRVVVDNASTTLLVDSELIFYDDSAEHVSEFWTGEAELMMDKPDQQPSVNIVGVSMFGPSLVFVCSGVIVLRPAELFGDFEPSTRDPRHDFPRYLLVAGFPAPPTATRSTSSSRGGCGVALALDVSAVSGCGATTTTRSWCGSGRTARQVLVHH